MTLVKTRPSTKFMENFYMETDNYYQNVVLKNLYLEKAWKGKKGYENNPYLVKIVSKTNLIRRKKNANHEQLMQRN